jgi:hypothetical protein
MAAVIFLALAVAGGKFLLEEGRSGIDPPQLVITCSSRQLTVGEFRYGTPRGN